MKTPKEVVIPTEELFSEWRLARDADLYGKGVIFLKKRYDNSDIFEILSQEPGAEKSFSRTTPLGLWTHGLSSCNCQPVPVIFDALHHAYLGGRRHFTWHHPFD